MPEQARELSEALLKHRAPLPPPHGPRYRVTDNRHKRYEQVGTVVYENDGSIQLRFSDGWDMTLSARQLERVIEPAPADPVDQKIDPRPLCILCAGRWLPAQGEDATVTPCDECRRNARDGIEHVPCPTCGRQPFVWRPTKHQSFCVLPLDHCGCCSWDPAQVQDRSFPTQRMFISLCDGCAKNHADGCERLQSRFTAPRRCDLCDQPRSAYVSFKLNELKDHWWNEGHGCGANSVTPA